MTGNPSWRRAEALIVLGLPLAYVAADMTLNVWFAARDACGDIGLVPGFDWLFTMAWMVPLMWAGWGVPLVLGRRHLPLAATIGLLVIAGVALWWLSGTTETIDPYGDKFCPGGVPNWWPAWLPH